jgi:tape measure domain-containing protein
MAAPDALLQAVVRAEGIAQTLSGLAQLTDKFDEAAKAASRLGTIGGSLVGVSAGISAASIGAFEGFERMQRVMQAMVGDEAGSKLANQIREFSLQANASGEALQFAAKTWISMTGDAKQVMPLLEALEKMNTSAGMTPDALQRAGRALAQIRAAGKVRAEEINQLIDAGVPLNLVQKELGLTKGLQQAYGMDADKFVDAFMRAMQKAPDRSLLPTAQIANIIETFKNTLIPTGRLLAMMASPILRVVGSIATVMSRLNEMSGGVLGLLVVVRLARAGFMLMVPMMRQAAFAVLQFAHSNRKAMIAANTAAGAAFSAKGLGGMLAGAAAMMALAPVLDGIATVFGKINDATSGWAGNLIGIIILLSQMRTALAGILTVQTAIKTIEVVRAMLQGAIALAMGNPAGAIALAAAAVAGGVGIYMGGKAAGWWGGGNDPGSSVPTAEQPQRRSSWENVYDRRRGYQGSV